jgi:hypothetical protein
MSYKNPLTYIVLLLFTILLFLNLEVYSSQHFVDLARSFASGSLSFTKIGTNISDYVLFQDKYYWPLGPFPAIILLPFVLVFKTFYQGFISFPLTIVNFYLLLKIARRLKVDEKKGMLLALFFTFGSIYFPLASLPGSWYFAQTVACTLLIAAVYEFLNRRRYFLIGLLIACAIATRITMASTSLFFLYYLFQKPLKFGNIAKFLVPITTVIFLLGIYNYARFKNPIESGYNYQIIPKEAQARRDIGLFSPKHIPSNLYYMFLKGPDPILNDNSHELKPPFITFDSYGLSLFFLSPILFLIFRANYKKGMLKVAAITSLLTLIPILSYYGIGQRQVGYRYALDFFPFIYLIVSDKAKDVSLKILYFLVFWGIFFSVYFSFLYLFRIMY